MNQNPKQLARDQIDAQLVAAGWVVQSKTEVDLYSNIDVAVKKFYTDERPADYILFVAERTVGVIEAKREEAGANITTVEDYQSANIEANCHFRFFLPEQHQIVSEMESRLSVSEVLGREIDLGLTRARGLWMGV